MNQLKRKKNKFNKAIILLSISFAVLLCAVTAIVYFIFVQDKPENSEATPDNVVMTNAQMPTESERASVFKPYKAVETEVNKEVPLTTVFGSAFGNYGGELSLNPDGTFTLSLGAQKGDTYGTYTEQDGKILVEYSDGKTDEFIVEKDENNNAEIKIQMGLYTIYFK